MRVRPLTKLLYLLVLQINPVVDEVVCENTTSSQECAVSIQSFKSSIERSRHRRDLRKFFSVQFKQVAVFAVSWIDLVLDTVKTSHQHCTEGDVRIGKGIAGTELQAFGFGAWTSQGDTNGG